MQRAPGGRILPPEAANLVGQHARACSARRARHFVAGTGVAVTMSLMATGCGILEPIDARNVPRLIALSPPAAVAKAGAASSVEDRTPACSEDGFAGDLKGVMCETDQRRVHLMREAGVSTNQVVDFNAVSWPVASALLYWKLKDSVKNSLLLPAAIATGAYGFLNSGIPDRDKLQRAAALELACALEDASSSLYTQKDFDSGESWSTPKDIDGDESSLPRRSLKQSLDMLSMRIQKFRLAAAGVTDSLAPQPGKKSEALDSIRGSLGRHTAAPAAPSASSVKPVSDYLTNRIAYGNEVLMDGMGLQQQILLAGTALRARNAAIDAELSSGLAAKAAPLRSPKDTSDQITAMLKANGAPVGVSIEIQNMTVDAAPIAALKKESPWFALRKKEDPNLQRAIDDVRHWLDDQQLRRNNALLATKALGCPIETVTDKAPVRDTSSIDAGRTSPTPNTPLPARANP